MTEEELQQKILEHEETIKTLQSENESYKSTIEQSKTDADLLNTRIQELKDHNRSLFLKITTPSQQSEPSQPNEATEKKPTLDTIVNKFLTKD